MAPNTILTEQITIFCDIRESFQKHVSIRFIFCIFQILFLHNLTWLILNPSFEQKSMNYYVVLYRNTISSYLKATKCLDTIPKKPWLLWASISEKGQKRSVLYENTGRPAKLKSTYGKKNLTWDDFASQWCCNHVVPRPQKVMRKIWALRMQREHLLLKDTVVLPPQRWQTHYLYWEKKEDVKNNTEEEMQILFFAHRRVRLWSLSDGDGDDTSLTLSLRLSYWFTLD